MALLKSAIRAIGGEAPNPVMLKIREYDPSTTEIDEILINEIDLDLEEMEASAARYFSLLTDKFPDRRYSILFNAMRDEELLHQRMLRAIREYKRRKSRG